MPPTPNSVCTPGGGSNARDAGELHCDPNRAGQCGFSTNRASAIAYFGVAAMKYADWDRLVVPVLAMTAWPALSTLRWMIFAGTVELPTMMSLMTCGL